MKIEKMTVRELLDLKSRVETQIPVAKATEIEALRTRIDEMAAQHGFATVEILSPSGKARNKRKQPARPVYCHRLALYSERRRMRLVESLTRMR